jgi:hypothetical protein
MMNHAARRINYRIWSSTDISHHGHSPHFMNICLLQILRCCFSWKGMLRMHISVFVVVLFIPPSAVVVDALESA